MKKVQEMYDKLSKEKFKKWVKEQEVVKAFEEEKGLSNNTTAENQNKQNFKYVLESLIEGQKKSRKKRKKSSKIKRQMAKKAKKLMNDDFASYFEKPINPSLDLATSMMHLQEGTTLSCSRSYEPSSGKVVHGDGDIGPRPITKYDRRDAYNRPAYSDSSSSEDDEDGFTSSDDEMEMSEGRLKDMYKKYKKKIIKAGEKAIKAGTEVLESSGAKVRGNVHGNAQYEGKAAQQAKEMQSQKKRRDELTKKKKSYTKIFK